MKNNSNAQQLSRSAFDLSIFGRIIRRLESSWIRYRIRRYRQIEGWLSLEEAEALYKTASRLPDGSTIVEIGSWKGKSTYCLARGLRKGQIIAIDPFDASGDEVYRESKGDEPLLRQFSRTMKKLGVLHKIRICQGRSEQFVGEIPLIQFLFIDGDHSKEACEFDFISYEQALEPGGYLAFHDYYPERRELGPTWVIDNLVLPSNNFKRIALVKSLWFGQKL
jgi:predicted O-methyltransferase YrrM